MAKAKGSTGSKDREIVHVKKKTYQGSSKRTKLSKTSANVSKKRYKGQGR